VSTNIKTQKAKRCIEKVPKVKKSVLKAGDGDLFAVKETWFQK